MDGPQGSGDALLSNQSSIGNNVEINQSNTSWVMDEMAHDTMLFPSNSDDYIVLTADSSSNSFCNWTQLNSHSGFSASILNSTQAVHITGLLVEDVGVDDKRYVLELGYGATPSVWGRHRFLNGNTKKLSTIQQVRTRPLEIPANETIYYRMKCETANTTCEVSFRYHFH